MPYAVDLKSRLELRKLANNFRDSLGLHDFLYFPIVEILDIMCNLSKGFSYEIVSNSALPPNIHAEIDIINKHISIKENVYDSAAKGNGRDRMTIAHEIGHYITICICGFKLHRIFNNNCLKSMSVSPEWQAKCFAGELLIPAHLTNNMQPKEIADKCGVSLTAATYQYRVMHDRWLQVLKRSK